LSCTIAYYDRNAEQFFRDTVTLDLSDLYSKFLLHMPRGGRILDAGCGSGRDSHYFLQHGYRVEAFDASAEMCRLASSLTGQTVHHKTFEGADYMSVFDGVWACASLLHIRRDSIDAVLRKLYGSLKPGGIMFVSFKRRDAEWEQNGRLFNGYNESSFQQLIENHPSVTCESIWISDDVRPERKHEKWLNALLQRAIKGQ